MSLLFVVHIMKSEDLTGRGQNYSWLAEIDTWKVTLTAVATLDHPEAFSAFRFLASVKQKLHRLVESRVLEKNKMHFCFRELDY